MPTLSIVIPIGPGDDSWRSLLLNLQDLGGTKTSLEVLLIGAHLAPLDFETLKKTYPWPLNWLESIQGRALQMNVGAKTARGQFLWFLHSDSRLDVALDQVISELQDSPADRLLFFNLNFHDGSILMKLNEIGVWFRSRILGLPFGDQGFLLSRSLFFTLGGFDEVASFGEDHLFVWQARMKKVPVKGSRFWISTSARKYRDRGWRQITTRHLFLTVKQGGPLYLKWAGKRLQELFK